MGESAFLKFADYCILDMEYEVWSAVMDLFWAYDKKVYTRAADYDEDEEETVIEYSSPVNKVAQRLDILGFSLRKARQEFDRAFHTLLYEVDHALEESKDEDESYPHDADLHKFFGAKENRERFDKFDFDVWLRCMREIIGKKLRRLTIDESLSEGTTDPDLEPYIRFLLHDERYDYSNSLSCLFYGFPVYHINPFITDSFIMDEMNFHTVDIRYVFRSMLAVCNEDNSVVLDCSRLLSEEDNLCEAPEKTIILTEGSTDKEILEATLEALHPELSIYYSFLDFHTLNVPGGTSALVNTLKTFISAGVRNRVIAVFDNDTAANDALRALEKAYLPKNIKVIELPHLDIARDYPTIGPQGTVNLDINGLACSIGLYFGRDVLTDKHGNLIPIQWTGYNQGLKQYQGEVINKVSLQEKYMAIVKGCIENSEINPDHDWAPMKSIFREVFNAFT